MTRQPKQTHAEWRRDAKEYLCQAVDILVEGADQLNTRQALVRMRDAIEWVFSESTEDHEDA